MNKKVKITRGIFRNEIGRLDSTFMYNGTEMYLIKITRVMPITGQHYFAYATVTESEFEPTDEKEIYKEC